MVTKYCALSQCEGTCVIGHGLNHDGRASAETGGLGKELSTCRLRSWFAEDGTVEEHVTGGSPVPAVFVLLMSVVDLLRDLVRKVIPIISREGR